MTEERQTMGTTGTPGGDGAARIDEEDKANGSRRGASTASLGGEPDDPMLPFDEKVDEDGKLHMPRNAGEA